MNNITLQTERLILRPVVKLDIDYIHELHSLPETDAFNTLGIPANIKETEIILEKWIFENDKENNTSFTFIIELNNKKETDINIGLIGINIGKEKYRNAEIWFKFHKDYWNKGYATEAARKILSFGFENLQLHRIEAGCAVENIGSICVLEKIGMLREAHTRQLLPLKSGWSDNYGYAILEIDFK